MSELAVSEHAEKAVLGALMLRGDPRHVTALTTRGLRPEHFYWENHRLLFGAAISLCDRQSAIDPITLGAELDRQGIRGRISHEQIDDLAGCAPAAGHLSEYADRVYELARWRRRTQASYKLQQAAERRDVDAWGQASVELESAIGGTRTESYSPEQWAALLLDYFMTDPATLALQAIPSPFQAINHALGGGLRPGEILALSGPTGFGKSIIADQWLDCAAKANKTCHLYMTEMTALYRGMRYIARRTGIPFMRQRRAKGLTDGDRKAILKELQRLDYGCTVAADWDIDDIVRDALRARYDLVVIDLLHGFHYEDERGLDRLSKGVQRLARVSTTLDGHSGTAVIAVTHLKEEGMKGGKVPRPNISSIKGGSSIKQDSDFVAFVWQEQDESGAPTGDGEVYLAKGRAAGILERVEVRLNSSRFRFDLRASEELAAGSSEFTEF